MSSKDLLLRFLPTSVKMLRANCWVMVLAPWPTMDIDLTLASTDPKMRRMSMPQ